MNIELIPVYKNLNDYLFSVEKNPEFADTLWNEYAIKPYWDTLCQYAPYDLSDRKPKNPDDILTLKTQIRLLNDLDLDRFKNEFIKAASELPNYDDDTIYIVLYPLDDKNITAKEKQNGVSGTSTFGNMLICINPLADNYLEWIPYVFAHEYHHTVWGNYWYAIHGGILDNIFINSLLIDGEADSFAQYLYPKLTPNWFNNISKETEMALWKNHYLRILSESNVDYAKYMFGNEEAGIPWCAGYTIGYRIIKQFLNSNPGFTFKQLLEMRPIDIYNKSGYMGAMEAEI